ncbi:MAG: UvrD-helicase domain-containing protein [Thermoguttaceae bacterium]|nr:UvrD-helicase domain-containing protein [Thermoguttaceae bacterium]
MFKAGEPQFLPPLSSQDEPLLEGLNEAQREAVTHKDGPMLVLAGPGSGKTRVVTHRVAWLLKNGVFDSQIAALTFTNKAAEEMKTRLQLLAPGNRVWIGTFHRFCAFLLRYFADKVGLRDNYAIYDADQSKKLLEQIVHPNSLPIGVDLPKIATGISWAKNTLVSADEYCARDGSILGKVIEDAYPAYQDALKKANAVDFDDLLFHIATIIGNYPDIRASLDSRFRYILVDEYQDTNLVQYAIARGLSLDYPNLAATGDPDQSIYGWRGANLNNILNFEQDFPDAKVVRLEQNYRSVKSVLRVADTLIKHNKIRKDKELFTENQEGISPRLLVNLDQVEEAETIAAEIATEIAAGRRRPRDYAIFYRMNAMSRNLEYALKRYSVPYQLVRGLEFFNRKEIKDLCAYLQLVHNTNDVVSFKRIINLPTRGIGNVTLGRLNQYAEDNGMTIFDAARNANRIGGISTRAQKALLKFVALIDKLQDSVSNGEDLEVVLGFLLKEIKYVEYLRNAVKTEEDEQKLANIQELLSEVREFDADFVQIAEETTERLFPEQEEKTPNRLGVFLEQIALISDVDSWNSSDDRVSLMTLHAAKGLEFPVVYIVALEEGILPHERSKKDSRQLEEERRLLFVGLTRAQEELRLSRTQFREFRGSYSPSISSRFLFEFPKTGIDRFENLQDWLNHLKEQANNDPHGKLLIPSFFERKEGVSQRRALWEQISPAPSSKDRYEPFEVETPVFSDELPTKKRSKNAVDEYVDPEPQYDYSQEIPEVDLSQEENCPDESSRDYDANEDCTQKDESSLAVDFVDGDFAFDFGDIQNSQQVEKRKKTIERKKSSNVPKVYPSALSTGASIAQRTSETSSESNDRKAKGITVNSFIQHKKYGVGVVVAVSGPSFNRILKISFLSAIGQMELPISDPELSLVAVGRKKS